MADLLGPQCFTCRKRQVKCDSGTPTCQRCYRDGLECRGYKRPLKIVLYKPPKSASSKKKKKPAPEPDHDSESYDDSRSPTKELDRYNRSRYTPSGDRDYLALLESFQLYEIHILPRRFPSQAPFKRTKIDRDVPWHVVPKVLQHCLIVSFRNMQPDVNGADSKSRHELHHYLGLSFAELQRMLPGAVEDPYGIALSCILLMCGNLLLPPRGSWLMHFDAAQRLISLRGGIERCLKNMSDSRVVLIGHIFQDIFTATTSTSEILGCGYSAHLAYTRLIPDIEADLMIAGLIFPAPTLLAVTRTNLLRASVLPSSSETFMEIWQSIETFDPALWAVTIMQKAVSCPLPLKPEDDTLSGALSGLTAFATCCQSAGLLYLGLSCPPSSPTSIANALFVAKCKLSANIRHLFEAADADINGPLHAQLWRFISWPMFVSAYARIGWHLIDAKGESHSTVQAEIDRIRATGAAKDCHRHFLAAEYLHDVEMKRALRLEWTWDDGFTSRCNLFL